VPGGGGLAPSMGVGLDIVGSLVVSSSFAGGLMDAPLGHLHQAELGTYTGTDKIKCQCDSAAGKVKTPMLAAS